MAFRPTGSVTGRFSQKIVNMTEVNKPRLADARFRSFAERYLVTRSHLFRTDPSGLTEDTWLCVLDARRAYRLVKNVSFHADEDIGPQDQEIF